MKINCLAVIPARSGSKNVPRKNIVDIGGYPLIAYSIMASRLSKKIERTLVSTDSREIADIALSFGADVPFLRPEALARDHSTDLEFVEHCIDWLSEHEGHVPEYFVHLRPTTPFRDPEIVDQAIGEFMEHPEATSLRSGHPCPESPFKWFMRSSDGFFHGIREGDSNDFLNGPRQNFPAVYIPNGYVDVLRTSFIRDHRTMFGDKMLGFVTPPCNDVDVMEDLLILRFEAERTGSVLLDELNRNSPELRNENVE